MICTKVYLLTSNSSSKVTSNLNPKLGCKIKLCVVIGQIGEDVCAATQRKRLLQSDQSPHWILRFGFKFEVNFELQSEVKR